MKLMNNWGRTGPHIITRIHKSGYSGHSVATRVATPAVLIALALSSVFAFVATVATQKNALHEGFDKKTYRSVSVLFYPSCRGKKRVATVATRYKNNIYIL
jgi:hypothetical protein